MNKMLYAAALLTMAALAGCATTGEPEPEPLAVAAANTGKARSENGAITTGSRIPGTRSNTVSSTEAAEAQKSMRDNVAGYTHKY